MLLSYLYPKTKGYSRRNPLLKFSSVFYPTGDIILFIKIKQLIPELLVEDLPKTLVFYRDILGFKTEIVFPEKKPIFAQIGKDNIYIMLYTRNEFEKEIPKLNKVPMGGSTLMYMKTESIEDFYQKIINKVSIVQPLHKTDYGGLEFTIEDCNGYLICFSESISK